MGKNLCMLSALEWSEAAYDKRTLGVIYNWAARVHCFSHLGGGENISYQIFMKRQFCWTGTHGPLHCEMTRQ